MAVPVHVPVHVDGLVMSEYTVVIFFLTFFLTLCLRLCLPLPLKTNLVTVLVIVLVTVCDAWTARTSESSVTGTDGNDVKENLESALWGDEQAAGDGQTGAGVGAAEDHRGDVPGLERIAEEEGQWHGDGGAEQGDSDRAGADLAGRRAGIAARLGGGAERGHRVDACRRNRAGGRDRSSWAAPRSRLVR